MLELETNNFNNRSNCFFTMFIIVLYWILYQLISFISLTPQIFHVILNNNVTISSGITQNNLAQIEGSLYIPWYMNVLHVFIFLLIIYLSKLNKLTFFNFKLPSGKLVLFTVLSSSILVIISSIIEFLISVVHPEFNTYNQQILEKTISNSSPITIFIMIVILAPITEEVMFRGFIMKGLFPQKAMTGFLVCALLFTLVHMPTDFFSFIIYFTMSLGLGYIYYKTNRIEASIFAHFLNNLLSYLL